MGGGEERQYHIHGIWIMRPKIASSETPRWVTLTTYVVSVTTAGIGDSEPLWGGGVSYRTRSIFRVREDSGVVSR
jgi:hypothetical protein